MEVKLLTTLSGPSGTTPIFLDQHTYVQGFGNSLHFVSLLDGVVERESFMQVPNCEKGITAIAYNGKKKRIAVAIRALVPRIVVIQYPTQEVVGVLTAKAAKLAFTAIDISREGSYLVAITSELSRPVEVFDFANLSLLDIPAVPLKYTCDHLVYSPSDPTLFCAYGAQSMVLCRITERHYGFELVCTECSTGYHQEFEGLDTENQGTGTLTSGEGEPVNVQNHKQGVNTGPTCLAWLPDGSCLCGRRDGVMYLHDPESGSILSQFKVTSRELDYENSNLVQVPDFATSVSISSSHYIIAKKDGMIIWINAATKETVSELSISTQDASQGFAKMIIPTSDYHNFLLFTSEGQMLVGDASLEDSAGTNSNTETNENTKQVEPSQQGDQANSEGSSTEMATHARITHIGNYQALPILYSTSFVPYTVGTTELEVGIVVDENGKLGIWDSNNKQLLGCCELTDIVNLGSDESIHLVSNHPSKNLCALSTTSGWVVLAELQSMIRPKDSQLPTAEEAPTVNFQLRIVLKSVFKAHNQALSALELSKTHHMLVTASLTQICTFDVSILDAPSLVGYSTLSDDSEWTSATWAGDSENSLVAITRNPYQVVALDVGLGRSNSSSSPPLGELPQDTLRLDHRIILSADSSISSVVVLNRSVVLAAVPKQNALEWAGLADVSKTGRSVLASDSPLTMTPLVDESAVAVGTLKGKIGVWKLLENTQVEKVAELLLGQGAITSMSTCSLGSTLMYSTQIGCSAFVQVPLDSGDSKDATRIKLKAGTLKSEEKQLPEAELGCNTLLDDHLEATKALREEYFSRARDARGAQISMIKEKLEALVARNEVVEDLEKLKRQEFIVNLEREREIQKSAKIRVSEIEEQTCQSDRAKESVIARLKEEVWDKLRVKGSTLAGFDDEISVDNFPIPFETQQEKGLLETAMKLRQIERHCEITNGGKQTNNFQSFLRASFPDDTNWIVNAGSLTPDISKILIQVNASDSQEASNDTKEEKDSENTSEENMEEMTDEANKDNGNENSQDVCSMPLSKLLYHPCAVRTCMQRRTQILLIQQICVEMREEFNKHFEALMQHKEDELDRIETKNTRIREILEDLPNGDPSQVFQARNEPRETPEYLMTITDDEVDVERYISRSERQRLEAEAEAKRLRDLENAKDNTAERALNDMMYGTLEVKKENATTVTLVRPEWMNEIEYNMMTPEQQAEFDEFVQKEQALAAEVEKQCKLLEQEKKRIESEIQEICKSFDERVTNLANLRLKVMQQIKVQELYMLRLSATLMESESDQKELKELQQELAKLKLQKNEAFEMLRVFQGRCDAHSEELRILQDDDRALDRGFKAAINEQCEEVLDQETLKIMTQLFKQRRGKNKPDFFESGDVRGSFSLVRRSSINRRISRGNSLERSSINSLTMRGSARFIHAARLLSKSSAIRGKVNNSSVTLPSVMRMNPYEFLRDENAQERAERERGEALLPLDIETDLPNGFLIEEREWNRLQDLRYEKILSELAVAEKTKESIALAQKLNFLQEEFSNLEQRIHSVEGRIVELRERIAYSTSNPDIIVELQQGQDEVQPEPVVTSHADSVLLHRSVIERENTEIQKLGNTKVETMEKIKDFRKSINYMEWEHKYMLRIAHDLEEHYTDLHMLRVTRSLQEFIKGGDNENRNREQVVMVEAKLEHMKRAHKTRLQKLSQSVDKVMSQIKRKQQENKKLEEHYRKLHANVSLRESVQSARTSIQQNGDNTLPKDHLMKSIVTTRKLKDLSRAQTEEIEFLRDELDRVRKKTYPCFQTGGSNLYYNPDDRYSEE